MEILLNTRDIRCVWVVNPGTMIPIKVDLGSGWAQAIAKIHGNKPIHASAWKMNIKQLKTQLKNRISPFFYQKEMSRIKRDEIIRSAKKSTKLARKEMEKVKETHRNSKLHPVSIPSPFSVEKTAEENMNSKGFNVITIHDAYRTLPSNTGKMKNAYNETMAEINESRLFEDIMGQITGQKYNTVPSGIPTEDIMKAKYSIC